MLDFIKVVLNSAVTAVLLYIVIGAIMATCLRWWFLGGLFVIFCWTLTTMGSQD